MRFTVGNYNGEWVAEWESPSGRSLYRLTIGPDGTLVWQRLVRHRTATVRPHSEVVDVVTLELPDEFRQRQQQSAAATRELCLFGDAE